MPIYEFHCKKCEKDSEVLVRSSDWQGTACPHCGSTRLEKKLSVFAASGGSETGGGMGESCCGGVPGNCGNTGMCCGGGPHRH